MQEEKFLQRYARLNKAQKQAVDTTEGPVLVIAGPGSGKTELLSMRVANILRQTDALPSSILCLTFTDSAALNMRRRLTDLIGAAAYQVAIHTFHSFGTEIINQNPQYFYYGANYKTADELASREVLEEILKNLPYDSVLKSYHEEQGYTYVADIIKCISQLKKAGLPPQKFKEIILENKEFIEAINPSVQNIFSERIGKNTQNGLAALINEVEGKIVASKHDFISYSEAFLSTLTDAFNSAQQQQSTKPLTAWKQKYTKKDKQNNHILKDFDRISHHLELAEVYANYQALLHKKGLFDFEDMILDTVDALEQNDDLRFSLQEKYLYVLVDEFQDTGGVQMRLLDNLLNNEINEGRPNIMAVGDDDQSIYKFQGANIENILSFHKKYLSPEIIVLQENYRSSQKVLDLVRGIILQGQDRLENHLPEIEKALIASNEEMQKDSEIIEKEFISSLHEKLFIKDEIQKKIDSGYPLSEIAIIAPRHRHLQEFAQVLDYFGIQVAYERKKNLLNEKHIQEIVTIIKFIDSLLSTQEEADEYLPAILSFPFFQVKTSHIWEISLTANKSKKTWLEVMTAAKNEQINHIAAFLLELGRKTKDLTAEEIIDIITGINPITLNDEVEFVSPFKKYYFSEDNFEKNRQKYLDFLDSLKAFIGHLREYKGGMGLNVKELLEFLELHQKHNLPLYYFSSFNNEENAVNLLTAHKAKGLEFDTVFLVYAQDDVWLKDGQRDKINFPINLPLSPVAEDIEDKIRLFYVAASRAKRHLYLTHHQYNELGKGQIRLRLLANRDKQEFSTEEIKQFEEVKKQHADLLNLLELSAAVSRHEVKNIDEADLLKKVLENYHLSVTHLNNFLDTAYGGPQTFLEQNLLRFPQRPSRGSTYGTAVHSALSEVYKSLRKTQKLPDGNFLLEKFKQSLMGARLNAHDFRELSEKGSKELPIYYEKRQHDLLHSDLSEFNFRSQGCLLGDANLTGKIDKLRADDSTREMIVYDFKTGKGLQKWYSHTDFEKIKLWKYKNQLIFYKLLVENSRDFKNKYQVASGILEFIEPLDGEISVLEYEITSEDTARLSKLVQVVYKKIMSLNFPDTGHYQKNLKGIEEFEEDLLNGNI